MSIKITTPGFVRGNVFWVEPPEDAGLYGEKEKTRPAVIISNDRGNASSNILTVLLF